MAGRKTSTLGTRLGRDRAAPYSTYGNLIIRTGSWPCVRVTLAKLTQRGDKFAKEAAAA